ncbi:malonyl-CoA/methylmalonyl-CoA synthetase [Algoriphagus iocasae]|uniref:Malonyl-CoA/methylmalonyl-CoA synthetase n=1 Tax=Algoriphagus iocasae TaxID=1836499 RepID=A0A841MR24_9BACT|nr:acyl-CoA synthetase [Algoriphagus iocasae]MBB6328079.1 malonyl-CoA/methylmalonyl-CoA synthetase [Algoriphagus iocasae]
MLQLVENAKSTPNKIAIVEKDNSFTFQELFDRSKEIATFLLKDKSDLSEAPVAFMVSPGFEYVATQWGIWRAGGIAVPLCIIYPLPSLQYVIEDTGANIILVGEEYEEILKTYKSDPSKTFATVAQITNSKEADLPEIEKSRGAMILYTSGTTSLPKGVLTTHSNIESQISTLVKAWEWSSDDYILEILPLHHVHGIINVLCCALWSGATVEFLNQFSAKEVFNIFLQGKLNVFMAVPTIYFKLIAEWEKLTEEEQNELHQAMSNFRLMISGSAALPVSVMEKWKEISGHYLLERYGMTEIGMAVSNPYNGERRAGHIGQPLPRVELRTVDEEGIEVKAGEPGEIQIKSPSVFKEYWGKPEATAKSFTADGWFKTGDIAVLEDGYYRILGRDSIDIIKSGGYKISALEIEEVLRKYPQIKDCGVVGITNEEWGELVVAALVADEEFDTDQLNIWMRERMPAYKTPRKYIFIPDLPRNAMGKVTKNELKKLF